MGLNLTALTLSQPHSKVAVGEPRVSSHRRMTGPEVVKMGWLALWLIPEKACSPRKVVRGCRNTTSHHQPPATNRRRRSAKCEKTVAAPN
jgi:hypothetical protein